jgi:predicted GTPase
VSNFYLEDKSICFSTFAAREGIKKRTPIAERKIQNEKRRLNRDRLKLIVEDQPGCTTPSTTEGTQSKTKNTKLTATQLLKAILFNSNYNQTDFFYFKYCLDTAETSEDENLGKIVFIDTYVVGSSVGVKPP